MSTVTIFRGKCYMCFGVNGHLPHCPEMMDETARDKMFPGRKRAITEPIPPTTPSKSTSLNGKNYISGKCAHFSDTDGQFDCHNPARNDTPGSFCIECAKKEGLI